MKVLLTFLLALVYSSSRGQVLFYHAPANMQFIGRDLNTNVGTVTIDGEVSNLNASYDSLRVEVYRNNLLFQTYNVPLNYSGGIAYFNLDFPINVELASYDFSIYGMTGNVPTLVYLSTNVVAGDVFIVQGQSNAEARARADSSYANQSNFIRVYKSGTDNSLTLLNNNTWHLGQGDGDRNSDGNTGQWGLKLARMLVDSLNVPVAIFNGGHGGKELNFFLATAGYQTSLLSNYGRMYFRLTRTGLRDHVRAVFWSQGERDALSTIATSTSDYKSMFLNLRDSWLTDYPNIEQFYIFQTKNGCNKPINFLMQVKEAQRQLAFENANISIMSTAALTQHTDGCHFPFAGGYASFAERLFPLVSRDLYGANYPSEIEPPMILDAFMMDDTTLVVETDAVQLSIDTVAEDFQLENAGGASLVGAQVMGKNIIFTLSQDPGPAAEISYLAQYSGPGNFITNQEGLELVCFYKYPIDTMGLLDINGGGPGSLEDLQEMLAPVEERKGLKLYPNPAAEWVYLEGSAQGMEKVRVFDPMGKEVTGNVEITYPKDNRVGQGDQQDSQADHWTSSGNRRVRIDISRLSPGLYILRRKWDSVKFQKVDFRK